MSIYLNGLNNKIRRISMFIENNVGIEYDPDGVEPKGNN